VAGAGDDIVLVVSLLPGSDAAQEDRGLLITGALVELLERVEPEDVDSLGCPNVEPCEED